MTILSAIRERGRYYASLLDFNVARAYLAMPRTPAPGQDPLELAIQWLCRAQDATPDGGVARSFSLVYQPYFRRRGWFASYPETTGYIIPTVYDYAHVTGREELFTRAGRMAEWESDVQMQSGAVQGGTIADPATPAVFNTGQVIFGWLRAFKETGNERYLESAIRAGDYLVAAQSDDGAWRKNLSDFASGRMPHYTYNTRSAWALLLLSEATGTDSYRDAAVRNVQFALSEQKANGWFGNNCLSDPSRPLVHTIAYAIRGILEVGIASRNEEFLGAARVAADAVMAQLRPDGSLAARYNDRWEAAAEYSCLTGNAQMGLIWGRLHQITGNAEYRLALKRVNRYTRSVQWRGTGHPGLDGGVAGSYPIHGAYGRFEILNWAVKFFADALMLESAIDQGE
jgi:uncharacterized protein YyaL (SSP411 family)